MLLEHRLEKLGELVVALFAQILLVIPLRLLGVELGTVHHHPFE